MPHAPPNRKHVDEDSGESTALVERRLAPLLINLTPHGHSSPPRGANQNVFPPAWTGRALTVKDKTIVCTVYSDNNNNDMSSTTEVINLPHRCNGELVIETVSVTCC